MNERTRGIRLVQRGRLVDGRVEEILTGSTGELGGGNGGYQL